MKVHLTRDKRPRRLAHDCCRRKIPLSFRIRPLGQASSALKVASCTFKRCGRFLRSRVETGSAGFSAISFVPRRLMDPSAVFSKKGQPLPPLTRSGPPGQMVAEEVGCACCCGVLGCRGTDRSRTSQRSSDSKSNRFCQNKCNAFSRPDKRVNKCSRA